MHSQAQRWGFDERGHVDTRCALCAIFWGLRTERMDTDLSVRYEFGFGWVGDAELALRRYRRLRTTVVALQTRLRAKWSGRVGRDIAAVRLKPNKTAVMRMLRFARALDVEHVQGP